MWRNRFEKAMEAILHGKWSPLDHYGDAVFVAVILTAYTAFAFFRNVSLISQTSIYNDVPDSYRVFVGCIMAVMCLLSLRDPVWGGVSCVIAGLGLRVYDAVVHHSPIGYVTFGVLVIIALIRIIERTRGTERSAKVMRDVRKMSKQITTEHIRHERFLVAETEAEEKIAHNRAERGEDDAPELSDM